MSSAPSTPIDPVALRSMIERAIGDDLDPIALSHSQRAAELIEDALSLPPGEDQLWFTRLALDFDSENIDALLLLSEYADWSDEQNISTLRAIVATAAHLLGPDAFADFPPNFSDFPETDAYLRARAHLATALHADRQLDDACAEYAALIDLDQKDSSGARLLLVPLLLSLNRTADASSLITRFAADSTSHASLAWSRVLERFLANDEPEALSALTIARLQNRHVEVYVLGRNPPKNLPDIFKPGSKEEALAYAKVLSEAWAAHPTALTWLSNHPGQPPESPNRPRRNR